MTSPSNAQHLHTRAGRDELIVNVVKLGQIIREHRADGRLQSIAPPTIFGFLAFVRMSEAMPHLNPDQIALVTLLGNASREDSKIIPGILRQAFGLQAEDGDEDPAMGSGMF